LVSSLDVLKHESAVYYAAHKCQFQLSWSPSINPRGAYFCEMAASLAMLYRNTDDGWGVEKGWWRRTPKDYRAQVEEFCPKCGGCLCLSRRPSVTGDVYDVSGQNRSRLLAMGVDESKLILHNLQQITEDAQEPLASYKEQLYRDDIARAYGIFLSNNDKGFNEPYLMKDFSEQDSLLSTYRRRYAGWVATSTQLPETLPGPRPTMSSAT
jgi:hypothetical protein